MIRWERVRHEDTGQTEWTKPGFIITKERGYSGFTLRTTPGDSWPIKCRTLHAAKMKAELPMESLRELQRQSFMDYHLYFAGFLGQNIDDRLLEDAVHENAYRFQIRQAA